MTEKDLLASACEQFLGKSIREIEQVLLQTLEGHLRAILGKFFCTQFIGFTVLNKINFFLLVALFSKSLCSTSRTEFTID